MEAQENYEEGRKKIQGHLGHLLKSTKKPSTPTHESNFQCKGEKILEEGFGSQVSICNPIEDDSRMTLEVTFNGLVSAGKRPSRPACGWQ